MDKPRGREGTLRRAQAPENGIRGGGEAAALRCTERGYRVFNALPIPSRSTRACFASPSNPVGALGRPCLPGIPTAVRRASSAPNVAKPIFPQPPDFNFRL